MTRFPEGFDVQGPVQAEVFVVWLTGDHLELRLWSDDILMRDDRL